VYIRCCWLGNHQIYGVYIRMYTVLANPEYVFDQMYGNIPGITTVYLHCKYVHMYISANPEYMVYLAKQTSTRTVLHRVCVSIQFLATVCCRLRHYTKLPWREIKTKNGLQALTKAKQRKEASAKSVRPARPLQLFSQQGLYNARPPRLQPKMGFRP